MVSQHASLAYRNTGLRGVIGVLTLMLQTACTSATPVGMDRLTPGARVRATYPSETGAILAGSVVRQINGSLEITADSRATPSRIVLSELERLDLSAGKRRGPAAVIGASVGILGGLLLGMACSTACVADGEDNARFAPIAGAALGLSIGALTGAIIAPEHWVRVQFR